MEDEHFKNKVQEWLTSYDKVPQPIAMIICRKYELRHGLDSFEKIYAQDGFRQRELISLLLDFIQEELCSKQK